MIRLRLLDLLRTLVYRTGQGGTDERRQDAWVGRLEQLASGGLESY